MPLIFVGIKSKPGQTNTIRKSFLAIDIVESVYSVYGGLYDVVMMVRVPTLDAYHNFVHNTLAKHPDISDFESFIVASDRHPSQE